MSVIPISLSTLHSHSIFSIPQAEDDWELVSSPTEDDVGLKSARMAIRDKDLFLAVGKEIRTTTLLGELEVKEGVVGTYKVLNCPHLNFSIQSLVINPTGRLLAVVGRTQLVVITLPQSGMIGSGGGDLHCKSVSIDEYQYSATSDTLITKALWHPWGGGNSLWILTSDGKLREYDITSPYDPAQSFTFLSDQPSSSRFTAVDPLSRYASSFSFAPYTTSTFDFSPLMIYVLIANGDLYVMSPVMPFRADIPMRYLQGLKAFTDGRLKRARKDDIFSDEGTRAALQSQWVDGLVRQVRNTTAGGGGSGSGQGEMVRLHPPHLTETGGPAPGVHRSVMRQGPVIYSPGPQEVGALDEEDQASDLMVMGDLLAITWSGGRVDIGLRRKIEPRWISSKDTESMVPTIPIVESILLPLPDYPESNAPSFFTDVLHQDSIYVQHSSGVDAICVKSWLDGDEDAQSEAVRLVESRHPIIGGLTVCNITLGYGLLALASSHQMAGVELDFRVTTDSFQHMQPVVEDEADHSSLLLAKPVDFGKVVALPAFNPKSLARKLPESNRPIQTISPAHLRVIGEIISQIRQRVETIRSASLIIENRLDLQMQEYQRQIKLLKETRDKIDSLKSSGSRSRAETLLEGHGTLGARLDKAVVGLSGMKRSELSQGEKKWAEELERLKGRVGEIAPRVKKMEQQLASIKAATPKSTPNPAVRPLEESLSSKADEIRRLVRRMETLSTKVEAVLDEGEDSEG